MCQYDLEYYNPKHSSLYEVLLNFYKVYEYYPTNLTCYAHLQCDRSPFASCLKSTEICDGTIDCLDAALDQEHCYQLEINEYNENEFRCWDGQCIPISFYDNKERDNFDCTDGSDHMDTKYTEIHSCNNTGMSLEAMFSTKNKSISDKCWSAFKCIMFVVMMNVLK